MIAAQAPVSTPSSIPLARPGPKAKPLAARQSLHTLRLAHQDPITTATITDGLLAQFKTNHLTDQFYIGRIARAARQ